MEKATIKIFIASSAELKEERRKTILVLNQLNKSHKHLYLEPIEWEYDTVPGNQPGYKNIQEAIDPRLKESHIAVFIFYSKIGQYTREEFQYATKEKKKQFVFFKEGFSPNKQTIKLYEILLDFKENLNDSVLYEGYKDLQEFEKLLYTNLNFYLSENYKIAEVVSVSDATSALSQSNLELIRMLAEKDQEIKRLNEAIALKPSSEDKGQLEERIEEKETIRAELLKSGEIIKQQAKYKEELEKQLAPQKEKDALKAKALEEVEKGNYSGAEDYLKESAKESITETASTFYELAKIKRLQLQYADALEYYELAAKINPGNALYLNDAGVMAENLGHYDKAIFYYKNSLDIAKRTKGKEQSEIADCYNNLGSAYDNKGEYGKAVKCYEKALQIGKEFYRKGHSFIGTSYNNLGSIYRIRGEYDIAIKYHKKALEIAEKFSGKEHHDIASGHSNLGLAYNDKGNYKKAIEHYEKALQIANTFREEEKSDIGTYYNNLGLAYKNKDEFDKAIEYYEIALQLDKKFYGENHPDVSITYNNLGEAFASKDEHDKAIKYYENALKIDKKFYGKEHPQIAIRYNNLGSAYDSKNEPEKAIEYLENALQINKKFYGEEHPDIAIQYNNLGLAYDRKNEPEKAIEYFKKSFVLLQKFLPSSHPTFQLVLENLVSAQVDLEEQRKPAKSKK